MAKKPKKQKNRETLPARICDYGTPELAQHGKIIKEPVDRFTIRAKNVSNVWPPERYYKRGTINDNQYASAKRFYKDFVRGNLSGHYGSTMFDPSKSFDSIYKELELTELQAESLLNFRRAWRSLNRQSADIIWHVVCNELDISGYEKMLKWREGYGMIRLREALDDLGWFYRRNISKSNTKI